MITEAEIIELIKKAEEGPSLDYKEDLPLQSDGDKAELVKDVIALANSGEKADIVIGVEDGTGKPVGLKTPHTAEQINQILKDKCDPPISVEYVERNILGYKIGIIEINGENPPYVVSVPDKFGGPLSANPQKRFYIQRGTIFIRNYNINEGAKRADLDKIYNRIKYVALQADLELSHEVTSKPSDGLTEANIKFLLLNRGDVVATDIYVLMQFKNVKKIAQCTGAWADISDINDDIPTIQLAYKTPVIRPIRMRCGGVVVKVDSGVSEIEARVIMGATNMRTKEGSYVISLKKKG
ncbi:MAG: ATP-binding protein [Dehalococcoidia bacterium]|nr:ATP-binding protein [Dehalococcoidia bacterium]